MCGVGDGGGPGGPPGLGNGGGPFGGLLAEATAVRDSKSKSVASDLTIRPPMG
jgi:hypothetical protein